MPDPYSQIALFEVPERQPQQQSIKLLDQISSLPKPRHGTQIITHPTFSISASAIHQQNLFIVTTKGSILRYNLEGEKWILAKIKSPSQSTSQDPSTQLLLLPLINKLLHWQDGTVTFLDCNTLRNASDVAAITGVSAICKDEYPGCKEPPKLDMNLERICVAKKRSLQSYELWGIPATADGTETQAKMIMERQATLLQPILAMARSGDHVCIAEAIGFRIFNLVTSTSVTLAASIPPTSLRPLIVGVCDASSFYVVTCEAPSQPALGIFVNFRGDPVRGTVFWPTYPRSVVMDFPYVLAMLKDAKRQQGSLYIHNLFSQGLVQTIDIDMALVSRGQSSGSLANVLRQTSPLTLQFPTRVVQLSMMDLRSQVDELVESGRMEEAVLLAERTNQGVEGVYISAGVVSFHQTLFDEAVGMFKKAKLDPRWLLSSYFDLISAPTPSSSQADLSASQEALTSLRHTTDIIEEHVKQNGGEAAYREKLFANLRESLLKYINWAIRKDIGDYYTNVKCKVLLKAEKGARSAVVGHLTASKAEELVAEIEEWMLDRRYYYVLLGLYNELGDKQRTVQLQRRMLAEGDPDAGKQIAVMLIGTDDEELLWDTAKDLITIKPKVLLDVFIRRPNVNPDKVIHFFRQRNASGLLLQYLEHVVVQSGEYAQSLFEVLHIRLVSLNSGKGKSGHYKSLLQLFRREHQTNFSLAHLIFSLDSQRQSKAGQEIAERVDDHPPDFLNYVDTRRKVLALLMLADIDASPMIGDLPGNDNSSVNTARPADPSLGDEFALEKAWSLIRMGEWDKGFGLLLNDVQDHLGVEEACLLFSVSIGKQLDQNMEEDGQECIKMKLTALKLIFPEPLLPSKRLPQVLQSLHGVRLDTAKRKRMIEHYKGLILAHPERYPMAIADHINQHFHDPKEFVSILTSLPDAWSLNLFKPSLQRFHLAQLAMQHSAIMTKSLSRASHLETSASLISTQDQGGPISVGQSSLGVVSPPCTVCKRPIMDGFFRRLPDGHLTHLSCGRRIASPVAGLARRGPFETGSR